MREQEREKSSWPNGDERGDALSGVLGAPTPSSGDPAPTIGQESGDLEHSRGDWCGPPVAGSEVSPSQSNAKYRPSTSWPPRAIHPILVLLSIPYIPRRPTASSFLPFPPTTRMSTKMLGKLPLGKGAGEDEDLATRVLIMLVIFAVSLVGE